jgi:hypothetical protein
MQEIHEIRVERYNPDKGAPNGYIVRVMGEFTGVVVWCSEKDLISTTTKTIKKVQEDVEYDD